MKRLTLLLVLVALLLTVVCAQAAPATNLAPLTLAPLQSTHLPGVAPAATPAVVPPPSSPLWEVSAVTSILSPGKSGGCVSRQLADAVLFRVWGDAGLIYHDYASGTTGGFLGLSTDAPFIPIIGPWFAQHVTAKGRYGAGYAYPSKQLMLYVRVPITSF